MSEEGFDYEEYAKNMYEQSLLLIPDDIGVGDKEYLATIIKQFSQMLGEALNNEHSEYSKDTKIFCAQVIAECTYYKGIDIIRAGVPKELRDGLLQKNAFVVFETLEEGIKQGIAQETLIKNVGKAVKIDFLKTIEKLCSQKQITKEVAQKVIELSNEDSLNQIKQQDTTQEKLEQYESDDEVFDFMREDLEEQYSDNDENATTIQEQEEMYNSQKNYWTGMIESEPNNIEGYINLCELERNNNPQEALEYINKAIEIDSNCGDAYFSRALVYKELTSHVMSDETSSYDEFLAGCEKLYNHAIADFDKAFSLVDYKDVVAYDRGIVKCLIYDEQGAYDDFKLSIEINPNFVKPYYELGKIETKRENYINAIEYLDKAIEIAPDSSTLLLSRGEAKEKGGNYTGAKEDYKQALELDPNDEWAKYQLERQEDMEALDEEFNQEYKKLTKYINENPTDPEGYYNRGYMQYCYDVDKNIVISDFDKAIELNPNYTDAIRYRIYILQALEEYDRAESDLIKIIEMEPVWESYGNYIIHLISYVQNGAEKALEVCNKAFELFEPDDNMFIQRGIIYENLKDYDNAIADYKKAGELNPEEDTWRVILKTAEQ